MKRIVTIALVAGLLGASFATAADAGVCRIKRGVYICLPPLGATPTPTR